MKKFIYICYSISYLVVLIVLFVSCQQHLSIFNANKFFSVQLMSGQIPVIGKETASTERTKQSVDTILASVSPIVREGLEQHGISIYVINNEEELDKNQLLSNYLFSNIPLELIYTNIDGMDETEQVPSSTTAQKLMQLYVYYPLELDESYSAVKEELVQAFMAAIEHNEEIDGPVYDSEAYSVFDEAHPHMDAPYFTGIGKHLGLAYEVYTKLRHPERYETEYYPITPDEIKELDSLIAAFLEKYMIINNYKVM